MTIVVILAASFALLAGALWGILRPPSVRTEGVMLAGAGGALIVAVMTDLVMPNAPLLPLWLAMGLVLAGGVSFVLLDQWIERRFSDESGFGLWLAVTLDGIPENLALGVVLIGVGPGEALALAAAILLSNLPEAAGGAREMRADGRSRLGVLSIWLATATILSVSAILGYIVFADAPPAFLAGLNCLAAGAVVASLAVEVFPRAFRESNAITGYGVTIGLILAYAAHALGQG